MWREIYEQVLKNVCTKSAEDFDILADQTMPKFANKLVINNDAKIDSVFKMKLNSQAEEKDYEDVVKYIAKYLNMQVDELLNIAKGRKQQISNFRENQFSSFGKDKEPINNRFFFG